MLRLVLVIGGALAERRRLYDVQELASEARRFSENCSCPFDCSRGTIYNNSFLIEPGTETPGFAVFRTPIPLDVTSAGSGNCQELDGLQYCGENATTCAANNLIYDCEKMVETLLGVGFARQSDPRLRNFTEAQLQLILEAQTDISGDDSVWGELDTRIILIYALTDDNDIFSCSDNCNYYDVCSDECRGISVDFQDVRRTTFEATNECTGTVSFLTPTGVPTPEPSPVPSPGPTPTPLPSAIPTPAPTGLPAQPDDGSKKKSKGGLTTAAFTGIVVAAVVLVCCLSCCLVYICSARDRDDDDDDDDVKKPPKDDGLPVVVEEQAPPDEDADDEAYIVLADDHPPQSHLEQVEKLKYEDL